MVKLTPNVTDVRDRPRAAVEGGADARRLINTINSIMGVDLDTLRPEPVGRRQGQPRRLLRPGGQADRPQHGRRDRRRPGDPGLPISGIGGIPTWQDAAEFLVLGAGTVQVCTAVMNYGFRDRRRR